MTGIQFQARLNIYRDGEREAIDILAAWEAEGHSRRYILTAALHALADKPIPFDGPQEVAMLLKHQQQVLGEMLDIVTELQSIDIAPGESPQIERLQRRASGVSGGLLSSIASAVKEHSD